MPRVAHPRAAAVPEPRNCCADSLFQRQVCARRCCLTGAHGGSLAQVRVASGLQLTADMERHVDKKVRDRASVGGNEAHEAPERWELDGSHTRLTFKLRHLIFQHIKGRFERCGGVLFLDRLQPSLSSAEVWVDLSSIDTESEERDAHVKSAEFLDVARFPRATFTSTTVDVQGSEVIVNGRLNLHGIVRDVALTVRPATMPPHAEPGQRQSFSINAQINRQEFGLRWNQDLDVGGGILGDKVDLQAHVEVVRAVEPTPTDRTQTGTP